MAIQISTTVTGETLGREFARDPEEAAYLFTEMAKTATRSFGREVGEHCWTDRAEVVRFLRDLADKIDTDD